MAVLMEEKVKEYQVQQEERSAALLEKESTFDRSAAQAAVQAWELTNDYLNLLSYPVASYNLYQSHHLPIPEAWFASIRALLGRVLNYGEFALTSYVDITFSELSEKTGELAVISLVERVLFMQKAMLVMDQILVFSEMHSKMRFVWIDLMARLAVLMKNIVNYQEVYPAMALDHPDHESYAALLLMVKRGLSLTTETLRRRYELKDQAGDDLDKALIYLGALKQIAVITNDGQEIDALQKKHDVWKSKLIADQLKTKES